MDSTTSTPASRLAQLLRPTWQEAEPGFPPGSAWFGPAIDSTAVMAEADGLVLTDALLTRSVAFAEFLAGQAFTADEIRSVSEATIADFERDPHGRLRDQLDISVAVRRIPTLSAVVRSRLRAEAISRIVCDQERSGLPASPTLELVLRYNPVVAVDVEHGVVVTDDAVRSWVDLREMIAAVAGQPGSFDEAAFRVAIDERFDGWVPTRRRELASAGTNLTSVRIGLLALDDDERADLADTLADQLSEGGSIEPAAVAFGQVGLVNDLIGSIRERLDRGEDPETIATDLGAAAFGDVRIERPRVGA